MLLNKPISVIAVSFAVMAVTNLFGHRMPEMPLTIPAFIGTAISILLSFKLNQSYDRWWEARKIWGTIVNDSRTLILQLNTFAGEQHDTIRRIGRRQIAWCYALGKSLRGLDPLEGIEGFLSPGDFVQLREHTNKPLALLHQHSGELRGLRNAQVIDGFAHIQLDNTLVRLCDAQGRAERIKSTVFPVTYRLFLHAIIYLFVITLSIALSGVSPFFEIPLLVLISSAFFLLEKSATHMQDPFENRPTDTAMTAIARTIEINIRQITGDGPVPEPMKPQGFYIK
jgi:putative membrane protein